MLPGDGQVSIPARPSAFAEPVNQRSDPMVDYEVGGVSLFDPNQGLQVKLWTLRSDGHAVTVEAEGAPAVVLFTRSGTITRVGLAFDQAMNPHVAFVEDGLVWLWWRDTLANAMVFTSFPGARSPCLSLDEKRSEELSKSDVLFSYLRADALCVRQQRDRYAIEEVKATGVTLDLISTGRSVGGRFQWMLQTPE